MSIDIDGLSYDELLDLNDRIIARLKHLDAADTINAMMKLNLGTKVCFDAGKHGIQVGTLVKFNQKTVTVLTDGGRRSWKVSPQMLSPVIEEAGENTNVIDLKKKK
ncbi:MAG: hypothetical protein P8Z67_13945 [Gammaproteobacteria bacterium]|jgi:hypothetical protein